MINFYEWNRTFKTKKTACPSPYKLHHKGILVNGSQLKYYESIKAKRIPPRRPTNTAD
jgi:hypothetical protein